MLLSLELKNISNDCFDIMLQLLQREMIKMIVEDNGALHWAAVFLWTFHGKHEKSFTVNSLLTTSACPKSTVASTGLSVGSVHVSMTE